MGKIFFFLKNLCHPLGIVAVLLSCAVPLSIYLLPKNILRELDLSLPLPLFLVQTILVLGLVGFLFKDFRSFFVKLLPSKIYSVILVVFVLALAVFASTQIEAKHRVQSDESIFLSMAQNMYHNHISGTCNQGEFEYEKLQCHVNSNSFKTKGLSFLYFLGMPLLGSDLHWAFYAQIFAYVITVLLFFFALLAWTREPSFSLVATIILAVQPTLLFQFRALSVEPLYILLFSLSLLLVRFAIEYNTWKHWVLLALVLAFFAQTRQETVFCIPAFVALALPTLLKERNNKAPLFILFLALFSVPVLITISYYQNFNFQGGEFAAHGHFLEHLKQNWIVMTQIREYGNLPENPFLPYFNYLTLVGVLFLIASVAFEVYKKSFGKATVFLIFLLLFHVQTYVILENVSGDFTIQINQRYSLVLFPTMAMLSAYPLWLLLKWLKKKEMPEHFALTLGVVLSLAFALYTFSYKDAFNANIMYNRNHLTTEESEIWKWLKQQDDLENKLFIYARPYHFVGYGLSAIHYDKIRQLSNSEIQKLLEKYPNEIYYIRGLDCWDSKTYHKKAVEHRIPTTCDHFERDMAIEPVYNVLITNSYFVEISKFNGKKEFVQNHVLSHTKTEEKTDGYEVTLKLGAKQKLPWQIKVSVSETEIYTAPYTYNDSFKVNVPVQEKGYHLLNVVVEDPVGKEIASYKEHLLFGKDSLELLENLEPAFHEQGWGSRQLNQSIDNNLLTINGNVFKAGIGTHAPSRTVFKLNGLYDSLSMSVGLDEEKLCSDGAKIKIAVDGQWIFESYLNYKNIVPISIPLQKAKQLEITTEPLQSMDCDHVDIVLPILYKSF